MPRWTDKSPNVSKATNQNIHTSYCAFPALCYAIVTTRSLPDAFPSTQPLHGWRELLNEVGVIVIGVLIALAAEQVVEAARWRDKMAVAERAMQIELAEDDGPQAYGRLIIAQCLDSQITKIHDGAGNVTADQLRRWTSTYAPPFRIWDSEAWHVILSSDVGSHLGPERLVQWSSPYRLMSALTDAGNRERELSTELQEALPPSADVTPTEVQLVRRDAALLRKLNNQFYRMSQLVLVRSQAVGAPVPEATKIAMLKEARSIYGQCVSPPDLTAKPVAQSLSNFLQSREISFGK